MRRVPIAVVAAMLAACSTFGRGDVQREWTNTFRELGILPVYPPREDVQVGDIYVRRGSPADTEQAIRRGFMPIDLYLADAGVHAVMNERYSNHRSHYPTTPGDWGPNLGVPRNATASSEDHIFMGGDASRLRQVAFPEFSTISINQGNLAALVPVKALSLAFAASTSSIREVQVKIANGESAALPAVDVLKAVSIENLGRLDLASFPTSLLLPLLDAQRAWARSAPGLAPEHRCSILEDDCIYLDLITEVYYTRRFEVSIERAVDQGALLDVQTIDRAVQQSANQAAGITGSTPANGQDPPPRRASAFERAEELNRRLATAQDRTSTGGTISFTSVSEAHVGLTQLYERPIAVGVRAMTLRIDPKTGQIRGAGPSAAKATSGGDATLADTWASVAGLVQKALRDHVRRIESLAPADGRITVSGVITSPEQMLAELNRQRSTIAADARAIGLPDDQVQRFEKTAWTFVVR
jgi:hypothetical protein